MLPNVRSKFRRKLEDVDLPTCLMVFANAVLRNAGAQHDDIFRAGPCRAYWMRDSHTFRRIGADRDTFERDVMECWEKDPHGCLFVRDGKDKTVYELQGGGRGETRADEFRKALKEFVSEKFDAMFSDE